MSLLNQMFLFESMMNENNVYIFFVDSIVTCQNIKNLVDNICIRIIAKLLRRLQMKR